MSGSALVSKFNLVRVLSKRNLSNFQVRLHLGNKKNTTIDSQKYPMHFIAGLFSPGTLSRLCFPKGASQC
jgi:hypothetical protein